jgi:hypothetical protein
MYLLYFILQRICLNRRFGYYPCSQGLSPLNTYVPMCFLPRFKDLSCLLNDHIASAYRNKAKPQSSTMEKCSKAGPSVSARYKAQCTHPVAKDRIKESDVMIEEGYLPYCVASKTNPPISVRVWVNRVSLEMKMTQVHPSP